MVDFNQAKQFADQHDEKIDQGLDKAGEAAKGRFAGQEQHIDTGVDKAQEMTGQGDTTEQSEQPPSEPPPA